MNGLWTVYEQQHLLQYVRWWRRHRGCIVAISWRGSFATKQAVRQMKLPICSRSPKGNNLWTLYKQIMNKSPLDRSFNFNVRLSPKSFCPSALRYLCLFLLPQAVFLSFVVSLFSSPVCLLRHASVGLWAMHEQFMNSSWTMLDWLSRPILGTNPSEGAW